MMFRTKLATHSVNHPKGKAIDKNKEIKGPMHSTNKQKLNTKSQPCETKGGPYQNINPLVHESRMCLDVHIHVYFIGLQIHKSHIQSFQILPWSKIPTVLSPHKTQTQLHFQCRRTGQELGQFSKIGQ